jgi:hypothetical protein
MGVDFREMKRKRQEKRSGGATRAAGGDGADGGQAGGIPGGSTGNGVHGKATEPPPREGPSPSGESPPPDAPLSWPESPQGAAYHGLAGEIVRAIEPETEADSVAILLQLLAGVGNAIGRHPYLRVESDRHYLNAFAVLVGESSKARKGTSWGRARWLLEQADPEWTDRCLASGLSSGEGLIWAVRDPITTRSPVKDRGRTTGYEEVESDPGVSDKRLLVQEPEFAGVLRQMERQGNTLSAILRQAWETGNIRSLTKNSPARVTGGHVSVVGHITADELRRYLTRTEIANGLGNRFLWACVRRSKFLPEGGRPADLSRYEKRLRDVLAAARTFGEITKDADARDLWAGVYRDLSEGRPGLAGSLTARGESQVLRLAGLYAVLDQSDVDRLL